MQFQFRPDGNNRTSGVVNTFTQQVLAETSLLAFEHVRQRFQRALVGTGNRAGAAAVIKQGVNRFLQHAFFIADNNIRGMQLNQAFQTVVAVNYPAVQIVQVRGGKTAAVQRNQRTQFRRNNRQHRQDHPFRFGVRFDKRFDNFQTFNQLLAFGFRGIIFQFLAD